MRYRFILLLDLLFAAILPAASLQNPNFTVGRYTLTPISSELPAGRETELTAINNNGLAAGSAVSSQTGAAIGLTYQNGVYSSFTVPPPASQYARVVGINNSSTLVGSIGVFEGMSRAFAGSIGSLTGFAVPGAVLTLPRAINDAGYIVGAYFDSSLEHGFVYSPDGTFTTIDAPGATSTVLAGINNVGQIVGYGNNYSSVGNGFLYAGGTFTPFFGGTPVGINDSGAILLYGTYGFDVLYQNGDLAKIEYNIDPNISIDPFGINNAGQIVAYRAILTPVPEPRSLLLLSAPLFALGARRISRCLRRRPPARQITEQ